MGEYAEEYFRREVKEKYGFDPGSIEDVPKKTKPKCPKCGKVFSVKHAVLDHLRDYHKIMEGGER